MVYILIVRNYSFEGLTFIISLIKLSIFYPLFLIGSNNRLDIRKFCCNSELVTCYSNKTNLSIFNRVFEPMRTNR